MNNVYIGSRYVPIFDGDWSNIKSYEPLVIVSYGNNTYTSKRPVPVGIVPTNTDYWVLTGNYNGMISHLEQLISDETVARIAADNTLQQAIDNVPTDREQFFANKKIMIIGDSLSDPDTNAPNWVTRLKTEVESYGGTVNIDFCNDGDSFAGISDPTRLALFDNYSNEWDIIIIALGINDYQGQFTIGLYNSTTRVVNSNYDSAACMNLLLSKLRARFPKALQYYCIPHRSGRAIANRKLPITYYRNAFGRIAQYYGCRIIDWSSLPMLAPDATGAGFGGYTTTSDPLHPTNVYSPILKEFMVEKLMSGGDNDWKDSWDSVDYPLNTEIGMSGSIPIYISSHGRVRLEMAATCSLSESYGYIITNFPEEIRPVTRIPAFVGNDWGSIDNFDTGIIVHQPTGQSTAASIYCETEWECKYPMGYYYHITD